MSKQCNTVSEGVIEHFTRDWFHSFSSESPVTLLVRIYHLRFDFSRSAQDFVRNEDEESEKDTEDTDTEYP